MLVRAKSKLYITKEKEIINGFIKNKLSVSVSEFCNKSGICIAFYDYQEKHRAIFKFQEDEDIPTQCKDLSELKKTCIVWGKVQRNFGTYFIEKNDLYTYNYQVRFFKNTTEFESKVFDKLNNAVAYFNEILKKKKKEGGEFFIDKFNKFERSNLVSMKFKERKEWE